MKNGLICLAYMFPYKVMLLKLSKKTLLFYIFVLTAKAK